MREGFYALAADDMEGDGVTLRILLIILALLSAAGPATAAGGDLFTSPGLGMTAPDLPRVVPRKPTTGVPPLNANQCQLAAGTCPLGRLVRSGNLCYCRSEGGGVRQGETQKRKWGGTGVPDSAPLGE